MSQKTDEFAGKLLDTLWMDDTPENNALVDAIAKKLTIKELYSLLKAIKGYGEVEVALFCRHTQTKKLQRDRLDAIAAEARKID